MRHACSFVMGVAVELWRGLGYASVDDTFQQFQSEKINPEHQGLGPLSATRPCLSCVSCNQALSRLVAMVDLIDVVGNGTTCCINRAATMSVGQQEHD
jgi:hypothetical protein